MDRYNIVKRHFGTNLSQLVMKYDFSIRGVWSALKTFGPSSQMIKFLSSNRLLTMSYASVTIWDLDTKEKIEGFKHTSAKKIQIWKDNFILINDLNFNIYDFDGNFLFSLTGHTDKINKYIVYGNKLISLSSDNTIRIWDLERQISEKVIYLDMNITDILVNGNIIANARNKIIIFNMDGSLEETILFKDKSVYSMHLINKNNLFLIFNDNAGYIYNIKDKQLTYLGNFNIVYRIEEFINNLIIIRDLDKLQIWDYAIPKLIRTIALKNISDWNILENNDILFSSNKGGLVIWNYEDNETQSIKTHVGIDLIDSFKTKIAAVGTDGSITIYK